MASGPVETALAVAAILDSLSIRYAIGGALASSLFGEPRATEDVDLVAEIAPALLPALVRALEPDFYVPEATARQAVARGSSFNVIHRASLRKVDIFVAGDDELCRQQITRRRALTVSADPPQQLVVATPEDVVLQKLLWYVKTGSRSDRQWRDVLGLLKVQGDRLDAAYLRRWADVKGILALLELARREAGHFSGPDAAGS